MDRASGRLAVGMLLVAAAGCQAASAEPADPGAPRTLADFRTILRANVHH